jgi:hypothetical protein
MIKQLAWANATNSSGFVPANWSKRLSNKQKDSFKIPPWVLIWPYPSLPEPFQAVVAWRLMNNGVYNATSKSWDCRLIENKEALKRH